MFPLVALAALFVIIPEHISVLIMVLGMQPWGRDAAKEESACRDRAPKPFDLALYPRT